jgi:hypothetical protein
MEDKKKALLSSQKPDTAWNLKPNKSSSTFMLSRDIVTTDGVWIGNLIYLTLKERNYK